jgi:hypothetical protein
LYSVMYTVYRILLSPLWLKSVPGWPAVSVITFQQSCVGQIVWFGSLSAISQLASRVGEGGGMRHVCLHRVTQPYTTWPRWREQGGGLCSLPLVPTTLVYYFKFNASAAGAKYLRRLGPVGRRYPNLQLDGAFAPYTKMG